MPAGPDGLTDPVGLAGAGALAYAQEVKLTVTGGLADDNLGSGWRWPPTPASPSWEPAARRRAVTDTGAAQYLYPQRHDLDSRSALASRDRRSHHQ